MASGSLQPSYVELWREPSITRPEPLRIVKEHANTITSCSAPREVPQSRRGSAGYPNASMPSPEGPHRPLMIRKKRRARGSVLDGSLGWDHPENSTPLNAQQATDFHNVISEDKDATPRVNRSFARTVSVGSFLKSELLRGSSESDVDTRLRQHAKGHPRDPVGDFNPSDRNFFPPFKLSNPGVNQHAYHEKPQRRQSKGKKLISKAFDSLGNARSKSMHFLRSKSSKDSLLRQASLKNVKSSRPLSSEASSGNCSRFSFEQGNIDGVGSTSISPLSVDAHRSALTSSFILYPEITVVPEVDSVDASDEVSIWVAVVINGMLQSTGNNSNIPETPLALEYRGTRPKRMTEENADYGYLYCMDVKLEACKGCILETVIADDNQSRRLYLGQTELVLAKVKLLAAKRRSSHVRESSKELIAELESQLGNTTTEYLAVRISYKHSAFPISRSPATAPNGLSYHTTTINIDAYTIIKRHCSQSSWGTENAGSSNPTGRQNPVVLLINSCYDPIKAARIIGQVVKAPISLAEAPRREQITDRRWNSSSNTIVPIKRESYIDTRLPTAQLESSASIATPKQSLDITQACFHDTGSHLGALALDPCMGLDPARKIWTEMRRNSRGTAQCGPQATKSGSETLESDVEETNDGSCDADANMKKEQARIMEIALRNKRSVGADTLRSMAAPSISMEIGTGRGWGWGPPWW